ncbi:MAG TPA: MltA domain-containing protein [Elusimicrobiales bacterium]|nr:MltA domain-containing protein [Elusimicrobiales bacterium]
MKQVTLVIFAALLAGCATGARKTPVAGVCPPCPGVAVSTKAPEAAPMALAAAPALPVFIDGDERRSLLKAAMLNRQYFQGLKPGAPSYTFGARKITPVELSASNEEFIRLLESSAEPLELDRLIKERFDVYQMAGRDSTGTVVFSSYYEPTLEASLNPTDEYKYPIYAKPDDLISVNLEDFNEKFRGEKLTGRLKKGELVPYLTREDIDFDNALEGKGLELAWFRNRADILDLQTEGSGRLQLPDGRVIKANFASTNSHKFKGWLTAMIEVGALPREGISHEKGLEYLNKYPEKARSILSLNKRYVFFKLEQPADPEEGPTGTYGLPLTGWRSIAMDNSLVPMGAIAYMSTTMPDVDAEGNLLGRKADSRFVFCQDTGGAIKGPGRVDFFAGNGKKSRTFAFKLWDPGQLYLLILKEKKT